MELRPKKDNPEEQRQNADMPSIGLHVLTKTKLRLEWLQGQVSAASVTRDVATCSIVLRACSGEKSELSLFLGEIGFGFGELRAISTRSADFGELDVKRLRTSCVAGGLRGARGAQQAVKAVW